LCVCVHVQIPSNTRRVLIGFACPPCRGQVCGHGGWRDGPERVVPRPEWESALHPVLTPTCAAGASARGEPRLLPEGVRKLHATHRRYQFSHAFPACPCHPPSLTFVHAPSSGRGVRGGQLAGGVPRGVPGHGQGPRPARVAQHLHAQAAAGAPRWPSTRWRPHESVSSLGVVWWFVIASENWQALVSGRGRS
jgi:hypothetical protein